MNDNWTGKKEPQRKHWIKRLGLDLSVMKKDILQRSKYLKIIILQLTRASRDLGML